MSDILIPESAPVLLNEALYSLFLLGRSLPAEARADLLRELPSDTFAADCCTIMRWGLDNYSRIAAGGNSSNETWAVLHAYFLAGALNRPEVVPCLLSMLAAPEAVLDFYFDEMLTDECWWPLRQYLPSALDECMAFLRREDVYEFSKSAVLSALFYAAYSAPEAAAEIMPSLQTYARERVDRPAAEPDLVMTEIATRLIEDGTGEGMSIGKAAFEAGLVDLSYAGDLQEVLKQRGRYQNPYAKAQYRDLDDVYDSLKSYLGTEPGDTLHNELNPEYILPNFVGNDPDEAFYVPQQPIVKGEKTGRNDPCPCGSGKKYKKCCLGKA